ncbi:MAG: rod shape-determining protein MreC [Gammaproteobacteria bacterium]|nr:MAG: rod shape-determining protein MreC [Gammaproteobacteria bacterium]TLZ07794.1 MAG: rod shape-determining protein MreC [Gammaproteobacteria bacterium]TLZ08405.1 MAG: rod shape-determining protein MreC [Gammaproteobacteria bacterium]TLZ12596.1 MAG: rod shape-determining protein MreC [Gammaproteobacteria bacterium]TLZ22013.1 MAG: rod shape-determining protein MreC [Gammaproteobacteria bacterium]
MAAFGTAAGRPLQGRDGAAGFRFTVYAALAVVIMYLDQRQHYLERLRYVLQAAAYPVQLAVNSPPAAWSSIRRSFEGRDQLQAENASLKARQRDLELRSMRYEDLARENAELRGLRAALPPVADRWLPAEIVNVQLSSLRQRLLIDRGAVNGVFKGQAVLDDRGLIGQTTNVGPWSAEVILITDPEHGTPVRIERTGLRTIAVGAGDATSLALPYLPANADIKQGDLLVTSGLGGVFPHGYPVARVTEVHREAVQPLAQVRAAPLAHIGTDSEVVLVWFRPDHPAAPAPQAASVNGVKAGNAALQPQAAPPRPTAAPAPAMPKPAPEAARTPPRTGPAPRPKPATEPAPEAEATSPAEGPPPAVESPESKPRDPAEPQPETQPPKGNR